MKSIHNYFLAVILLMIVTNILIFQNRVKAQTVDYLLKYKSTTPYYTNSLLFENNDKIYFKNNASQDLGTSLPANSPKFTINADGNIGPGLKIIGIRTDGIGIDVDGSANFNGFLNILGKNSSGNSIDAIGAILSPKLITGVLYMGNINSPGMIATCAPYLDLQVRNPHLPCIFNPRETTDNKVMRLYYHRALVYGTLQTDSIQITEGAGPNKVLVSDKAGHGIWTKIAEINDNDWIRTRENDLLSNSHFVGIGIDPLKPQQIPDSKLLVTTDDRENWACKILNTNESGKGLYIKGGAKAELLPILEVQEIEGNSIFVVNSNRRCGIGTNAPTRTLDVAGDIALTGAIYGRPSNIHNWNKLELFGSSNPNTAKIEVGDGINDGAVKLITRKLDATIQFSVNGKWAMEVSDKLVSIGDQYHQEQPSDLKVYGKIYAREVKVTLDQWYDNVFNPDYKILPLGDLNTFIHKNKHLPEIPSEKEVLDNGVNVGEMNSLLLKKIEELTLYVIDLKKVTDSQAAEISNLKNLIGK
jgi:hypothetical protein